MALQTGRSHGHVGSLSGSSYSKTDSPRQYKMNSFFAGIGGFDVAFDETGFAVAFQCEINPYCQHILGMHWPDIDRRGDINELRPDDIPSSQVWCGGFPCQDVSVAKASERLGLQGSQSGLFFRYAELVEACRPEVVVVENVTGLLNSNRGRDFRVILDRFMTLGYAISWRELNSRYFGVPQSRPRIFMCAWLKNPHKAAYVLFEDAGAPSPSQLGHPRHGFLEVAGDSVNGPVVPKVAYCLAATSGRHTGTDWSRTYVSYPGRVRRLTPVECEALQGFRRDWTLPATNEFGDPDKTDTLRYTALGNAVTVPVVKWIAQRIGVCLADSGAASESKQFNLQFHGADDGELEVTDFRRASDTMYVDLPHLDGDIPEDDSFIWPNAGLAWQGACMAARVVPAPSEPVESSLISCIEHGQVDERYFISPNAAEGILRRVSSQGRRLFAPLYNSLRELASQRMTDAVADSIHGWEASS